MRRISTATKVVDKFGAGKHGFTDGNSVGGIPATDLEAQLFDHMQEELAAILEEDGGASAPVVAVDGSARNQVITKLKALFARKFQAAETVDGTAKVATQAQTNAGADDTTIVTPKKLRAGFAISLGTNGYIALPSWLGGLVIQWGTTSSIPIGGGVSVTFPISFPTGPLVGVATPFISSSIGTTVFGTNVGAGSTAATMGIYANAGGTAQPAHWIAIGR
jgi:hypothetical protein